MGTYFVSLSKAEITHLAEMKAGMILPLSFGPLVTGKTPTADLEGRLKVSDVVVHPPSNAGKVVELVGTLHVGNTGVTASLRYYPEYKTVVMRTGEV